MKSENIEIREDGTLEILITEEKYEFRRDKDYWLSKKDKVVLSHGALLHLADSLNVRIGEPKLLISHNEMNYVFSREAGYCNRKYFAVGEANKNNLLNDVALQFPAETADNRAVERAIIGVLELNGQVYGASELEPVNALKETAKTVKKESVETQPIEQEEKEPDVPVGQAEFPVWWNDDGTGLYTDTQLNPETFIVTEGQCADKNWTVKRLYEHNYKSCCYYAYRTDLDKASEAFQKQVFVCRRAIKKYGLLDEDGKIVCQQKSV